MGPSGSKEADSIANLLDSKPEIVESLQSRVLKWTTDDITNSTLFKTKVGVIPMEFSSIAEYHGAFRVPLLEEVRAQLHQALEKSIAQSDCRAIVNVRMKRLNLPKGKKEDPSMRRFSLHVSSPLRSSDLILLCCNKLPKWDSTRGCLTSQTPHEFFLVYVNYAREGSPVVQATAYAPDGSPILERMRTASSSSWHVVLLGMSLVPSERIWKSITLKPKSATQVSKMSVTQDVLRIYQQVVPAGINSLVLPQTQEGAHTLQLVEDYCNSRRLNDSQRDALKSAVAGLLATDVKPQVRMVQGPPGTGKTAMLVTLISVLGCLNNRTLISAPTNAAVIEVSKRLMRFFDVEPEKEENLMQQEMFSGFCTRVRKLQGRAEARQCSPIDWRDVILVGSKGRMEGMVKGSLLEKVFLPYRVERLTAALSPTKGWKGTVQSVETFLVNAPKEFETWYRNKALKNYTGESGSGNSMSLRTEKDKLSRNASFWSFAKKRMIEMQAEMEKHLIVLTSELPRCHLDEKTSKAMTTAFGLMKRIVNAMPSKTPSEAKTWFSTTTTDTLSEGMFNLSLSGGKNSSIPKLTYLQAREALMKALASRPGCKLLATKQNPQGRQPKYGWLRAQCFKSATLVFSTVSTSGSPLMTGATFECAIIDEASQLVEAESTIVSGMRDLKQLILVGDHKQLPATVISKVAEKCGYGRSLFDRLQSLQHGCRHMLNCQYRMKPQISYFPNAQFYESGVKDGLNVLSPLYGTRLVGASPYGAYAFLNCELGAEVAQEKGLKNPEEVAVVTKMVKRLGQERNLNNLSIGVISPYAMQVEALKQSLGQLQPNKALEVEVKTVDGFQGNERDVIIFSAVRANHNKQIGFVRDCRRLNVAITRGRYCVWIVGNAETLSGGGEIWKKLITDARARNCYHVLKD